MNLGLEPTNNFNSRLATAIADATRSGLVAKQIADSILAGTSFSKKIISEDGIGYADREIMRADMVRARLIVARKNFDDAIFVISEYIRAANERRKVGRQRVEKET